MTRIPRIFSLVLLLAASLPVHAAPTGLLNDTGQDTCYDGTNLVACATGNSGDAATYPRQDGRFGRDAKTGLAKTGAGAKAFDYTKVCFNGDLEGSGTCTGTLVANTTAVATGTPTTDWACTKDNLTNLIWSLESGYGDWITYATTTLPTATNAANRCGYNTDWRLPTRRELLPSCITAHGARPSTSPISPAHRAVGTGAPIPMRLTRPTPGTSISMMATPTTAIRPASITFGSCVADSDLTL